MTPRTRSVLDAIEDNPGSSNRQIGRLVGGVDDGQLSKLLHRLEREGLIRQREGKPARGAPCAWFVADAPAALEPALMKADLKVLRAVPASYGDELHERGVTLQATGWQIAEVLDTLDLPGVLMTLNGLEALGYVRCAPSLSRGRNVWWRTVKGDQALT